MKELITYCFVLFFTTISCKAQENCVYDDSIITEDFLQNSELVNSYKWNDEEKEGLAILENGAVLNVKKWACNHIGTSANLMLTTETFEVNSWKNYIKELSVIICDKYEFQLINNNLSKIASYDSIVTANCRKEVNLSNDKYPEFYISIYELEDVVVISIFYYKTP